MPETEEVGFSCTACGRQYRWKAELAGKTVKCKCGGAVKVPRAAGAVPDSAPTARVPSAKPQKPAAPAPAAGSGDEEMDALYALAQSEANAAADETNFCPNCRAQMQPEAVLCMSCGYDRRKGKAIAAAKVEDPNKPKKGLFGFGKAKPLDYQSKKKKAVDALAPQGSFFVGLTMSFALALGAGVIWFLVAWGLGWDVFFLVTIVGVAAGVGMQIGQKGYSTMGGLAAAGVTLVVMILARVAVIVAIVLPILRGVSSSTAAPADPNARTDGREDVGDIKDGMRYAIKIRQEAKAAQQAEWDKKADPPKPPENPLLLEYLREKGYEYLHADPKFASPDQHNGAMSFAEARATTMPVEEKKKIIAEMEVREKKVRTREELIEALTTEGLSNVREEARTPHQYQTTRDEKTAIVDKMTQDEQEKELVSMRERVKMIRAVEEQKHAEESAKRDAQKAEEKAKAAEQAKVAAAADGLDAEPAGAAAATTKPTSNADAGDGLDGGPAVASTANAAPTTAATAIASATNSDDADESADGGIASGANGAGSSAAAHHSAVSSTIIVGFGAIMIMIFFGGLWSFLCLLAALFLAYRTAAGSVKG